MPPKQGVRRLVATKLATMPPGEYTDPAAQGLQMRVRKKRGGASRTWLFRYRWRGEWVRQTIGHYPGTDLADAREITHMLRRKLDEGIDPRRADVAFNKFRNKELDAVAR